MNDEDDDLRLLSHQGPIAGARQQPQQQQSYSDGGIPLRSQGPSTTTPTTTSQRKSKRGSSSGRKGSGLGTSIKDFFGGLLGKQGAASGTAGEGGERIIYVNNPELNDDQKFLHNRIFTAKYTIITFMPRFLYEEFSKYANLFFLFISGIQVSLLIIILIIAISGNERGKKEHLGIVLDSHNFS